MSDPVELSIVIPCYNEEKNIPFLLRDFAAVLASEPRTELILVDNGSEDQTGQMIDREISEKGYTFARKVRVVKNQGYGFGILSGLKQAKGELLSWSHADLQTDPADIVQAHKIYRESVKKNAGILVKGHRKNRKLSEHFFSFGMQVFSSLMLGTWLTEINAQPKLFPRSLYESMKNPPEDFSLDLYALYWAKRCGFKIVSFPVYFRERKYGEAKGGGGSIKNRLKLIRRTFSYIFKLKKSITQNAGFPCSSSGIASIH